MGGFYFTSINFRDTIYTKLPSLQHICVSISEIYNVARAFFVFVKILEKSDFRFFETPTHKRILIISHFL